MDMYILVKGQSLNYVHTYFLTNQLDHNGLFDWIHIKKLYNLNENDQMVFNQMEHLLKMVNDFLPNVTWSITLCIYILPIHPRICLIIFLLMCYPPTHPPTYFPTHLPTCYLHIYPLIYLIKFTN
jgi:hypothetical protein